MIQYKVDSASIPWGSPEDGMRQKVHIVGLQQIGLVE